MASKRSRLGAYVDLDSGRGIEFGKCDRGAPFMTIH